MSAPSRVAGSPLKRAADLVCAVALLVMLAPLLICLACAVALFLGRPVLFRQRRPGLLGRPFWLAKFRTMTDARGPDGALLSDSARLTRFGRLLRSTSLDELPELVNVVRGEMSLVGPRPLLMEYLDRYTPEQARRHEARPGITGLAQVRGRNALDWGDRFALDVWYVDHWTPWLDLRILWETVGQVAGRRGISAAGHATMPAFGEESRSPGRTEPGPPPGA